MAEYLIIVENLVSRYGEKIVHKGLNLKIKKGELYAIVGESGSGKTTLLRELLLLRPIDGGRIIFNGKDITKLSPGELEELKKRIGVMFQFGTMFSSLSVGENLVYVIRRRYKIDKHTAVEMAKIKLTLVGLKPHVFYMYPHELSGGMRKKASLAMAIATDPDVVFLDEPTSGLDPISAEEFDKLVRTLVDSTGMTIVQITHDLASLLFTDRVAVLSEGKVVYEGEPKGMVNTQNPWLRKLVSTLRFRRLILGK